MSFVFLSIDRVRAVMAFLICLAVELVVAGGLVVPWKFAVGWRRKARENVSF